VKAGLLIRAYYLSDLHSVIPCFRTVDCARQISVAFLFVKSLFFLLNAAFSCFFESIMSCPAATPSHTS